MEDLEFDDGGDGDDDDDTAEEDKRTRYSPNGK